MNIPSDVDFFRIIHISRDARNKLMIDNTNHLENVLNNIIKSLVPFL